MQVGVISEICIYTKNSRLTYAGDFNCFKNGPGQMNLSPEWWSDQMDEHSAKVIEIEKLTGLKEYLNNNIQ